MSLSTSPDAAKLDNGLSEDLINHNALNKREVEDVLRHKIDQRPTRSQLIEQNILKDVGVAPALQRSQLALERHQLEDALGHKLAERPEASQLVERGILSETDAPVE